MAKKRPLHNREKYRRRFIAPGARPGNGHGYLTEPPRPFPEHADPDEIAREAATVREGSKLCDEPEVGNVEDFALLAELRDRERRRQRVMDDRASRTALAPEQRIVNIERRAKQQHRNISGEVFIVRSEVRRALNGGRRVSDGTLRRIQRLEESLDNLPEAA